MPRGQIQKVKDFLQPHIDKRIICNKLIFLESKKFDLRNHDLDKSVYLIFGAFNNETKEMQKVTYEPKTGYLSFELHFTHVS